MVETCPGSPTRSKAWYWYSVTTDGVTTFKWFPVENVAKIRINDSILKPLYTEITLADFDHSLQNSGIYEPWLKIKLEDIASRTLNESGEYEEGTGKVIFYGRVQETEVKNETGATYIVLHCKDSLAELEYSFCTHDFSGSYIWGGDLIKGIIDYHIYTELEYSGSGNFTVGELSNPGNWVGVQGTKEYKYIDFVTNSPRNEISGLPEIKWEKLWAEAIISENTHHMLGQQLQTTENCQLRKIFMFLMKTNKLDDGADIDLQFFKTDGEGDSGLPHQHWYQWGGPDRDTYLGKVTIKKSMIPLQSDVSATDPYAGTWICFDFTSQNIMLDTKYVYYFELRCVTGENSAIYALRTCAYTDYSFLGWNVEWDKWNAPWTNSFRYEKTNGPCWFQALGDFGERAGGRARIIYDAKDDIHDAHPILVVTDVIHKEYFIPGCTLVEYNNEACLDELEDGSDGKTGVTATLTSIVSNINTDGLLGSGPKIDMMATRKISRGSSTPLQLINDVCLKAGEDRVLSYYLLPNEESEDGSLFPPEFIIYDAETVPEDAKTGGMTIQYKYDGEPSNGIAPMLVNPKFSDKKDETYTEAQVFGTGADDKAITSVKKAGEIAYDNKILKTLKYQDDTASSQIGLNNSVSNTMNYMGNVTVDLVRGNASIPYYPVYSLDGGSTNNVLRAGEKTYLLHEEMEYLKCGNEMVVSEIEYEEPNGTARLQFKSVGAGLGGNFFSMGGGGGGGGGGSTNYTSYPGPVNYYVEDHFWYEILPAGIYGFTITKNLQFRPSSDPTKWWNTIEWNGYDSYDPESDDPIEAQYATHTGISFNHGVFQNIKKGSFTIAKLDDALNYIYCDLDNEPDVLKHCSDDTVSGSGNGYNTIKTPNKVLLCVIKRAPGAWVDDPENIPDPYTDPTAFEALVEHPPAPVPFGNLYIEKISIWPMDGTGGQTILNPNKFLCNGDSEADPPILGTFPWIDMEGLTTYDFNFYKLYTLDNPPLYPGKAPEYNGRYLMAINETQVWPVDGMLRLTYETQKINRWYDEGGVTISSDFGVGFHGDMSFSTFKKDDNVGNVEGYNNWYWNMDYQSRQTSPDWTIPRLRCVWWEDVDGNLCTRDKLNFYYRDMTVNPKTMVQWAHLTTAKDVDNLIKFIISNEYNATATNKYSKIVINVGCEANERATLNIAAYFGSDLLPSRFNGQTDAAGIYYTDWNLGNSTHVWNQLWVHEIHTGTFLPLASCWYDLGSSTLNWRSLYLNVSACFYSSGNLTGEIYTNGSVFWVSGRAGHLVLSAPTSSNVYSDNNFLPWSSAYDIGSCGDKWGTIYATNIGASGCLTSNGYFSYLFSTNIAVQTSIYPSGGTCTGSVGTSGAHFGNGYFCNLHVDNTIDACINRVNLGSGGTGFLVVASGSGCQTLSVSTARFDGMCLTPICGGGVGTVNIIESGGPHYLVMADGAGDDQQLYVNTSFPVAFDGSCLIPSCGGGGGGYTHPLDIHLHSVIMDRYDDNDYAWIQTKAIYGVNLGNYVSSIDFFNIFSPNLSDGTRKYTARATYCRFLQLPMYQTTYANLPSNLPPNMAYADLGAIIHVHITSVPFIGTIDGLYLWVGNQWVSVAQYP